MTKITGEINIIRYFVIQLFPCSVSSLSRFVSRSFWQFLLPNKVIHILTFSFHPSVCQIWIHIHDWIQHFYNTLSTCLITILNLSFFIYLFSYSQLSYCAWHWPSSICKIHALSTRQITENKSRFLLSACVISYVLSHYTYKFYARQRHFLFLRLFWLFWIKL